MWKKFLTNYIPEGRENEYLTEEQTQLLLGKVKRYESVKTGFFISDIFVILFSVLPEILSDLPDWVPVAFRVAKWISAVVAIVLLVFILIRLVDIIKTAKDLRKKED